MPKKKRSNFTHKKAKSTSTSVDYIQVEQHATSCGFHKITGRNQYVKLSSSDNIADVAITHIISYTEIDGWSCRLDNTVLPRRLPIDTPTEEVLAFITEMDACKQCDGNIDFQDISTSHRSKECKLVVGSDSTRCQNCSIHRGTLRKARSRNIQAQSTSSERVKADSKARFTVLTKDELIDRCRNLSAARKRTIRENESLKSSIRDEINHKGIECDKADLNNICEKTVQDRISELPIDSVKRLFLEEQIKGWSVKSTGRRWHPTILRWCLIMHKKSKSLYRYIRESEFVCLPSQRTLSDYRCFKPLISGIDQAHILETAKQLGKQDVSLLIDEMKVQEGLIYNVSSGDLYGFVDDVDAEALLDDVAGGVSLLSSQTNSPPLASHALCFMMRGLKSPMQAVVATYATHCLTAKKLYHIFWNVVANLELTGFRVRSCVSDGASINRKLYKLHSIDFPDDPITHRAINKYSGDLMTLYFVSDTCHLMKTTRNGVENSGANRNSRRLVMSNKLILWSHFSTLVEERRPGEITKLHKLTNDHIKMTSYGRMKVRYAVQVLSRSVANALRMKKDPQHSSTITFVEMFNDAFDILNIRGLSDGTRQRNTFKERLSSLDDWRFEWIKTFMTWLQDWQKEVQAQDISAEEKSRCILPLTTLEGWYITCNSFLRLSGDLLTEGYEYILTERLLCQDPVEQYFSKQRDSTGSNNNPTMSQFLGYNRLHNICESVAVDLQGNCSKSASGPLQINSEPLQKRPRSTSKPSSNP